MTILRFAPLTFEPIVTSATTAPYVTLTVDSTLSDYWP